MKIRMLLVALVLGSVVSSGPAPIAQTDAGIDPEALISRILAVQKSQRAKLQNVVFDAELIEGKLDKSGGVEENIRISKKVYLKYLPDTVLFTERYIEFYEDGKLKSHKKRNSEYRERLKKKKKRGTKNISFPMLRPFMPQYRDQYDITYRGIADDQIDSYVCHRFNVKAKEQLPGLINGDFYFEAQGFNLVQVDFSPAKLRGGFKFKLRHLNMSVHYQPAESDIWLPRQFDIEGKGKAIMLIGVEFAATEYFRTPIINGTVDDSLFVEAGDD
ncbi:MAG: hypothetical protein ACE5FH_01345 [Candidatus Zixiibacteriota bacterium]